MQIEGGNAKWLLIDFICRENDLSRCIQPRNSLVNFITDPKLHYKPTPSLNGTRNERLWTKHVLSPSSYQLAVYYRWFLVRIKRCVQQPSVVFNVRLSIQTIRSVSSSDLNSWLVNQSLILIDPESDRYIQQKCAYLSLSSLLLLCNQGYFPLFPYCFFAMI